MKKYISNFLLLVMILCVSALYSCSKKHDAIPERRDIIDAVFASGNIFYQDEYLITSNAEGYIKHTFKKEGDQIVSGEKLFYISNDVQLSQQEIAALNYSDALTKASMRSPLLGQKKAQIDLAVEQLRKDSIDFGRNKRLYETKAISKLTLENSELQYQASKSNLQVLQKSYNELASDLQLNVNNSRKQLDIQKETNKYNTLTSSIDGYLAERYKQDGDLVKRGDIIAKVVGGRVKIKLYIAEEDVNKVKAGQTVVVSLNTEPQNKRNATIIKLYPIFNIQDQSFIAEAEFDPLPNDIYLFTQTQLQANIIIAKKSNALVIPASYLTEDNTVMIKGQKEPLSVVVGVRNNNWVEIVSGLTDSQVLTSTKE